MKDIESMIDCVEAILAFYFNGELRSSSEKMGISYAKTRDWYFMARIYEEVMSELGEDSGAEPYEVFTIVEDIYTEITVSLDLGDSGLEISLDDMLDIYELDRNIYAKAIDMIIDRTQKIVDVYSGRQADW